MVIRIFPGPIKAIGSKVRLGLRPGTLTRFSNTVRIISGSGMCISEFGIYT